MLNKTNNSFWDLSSSVVDLCSGIYLRQVFTGVLHRNIFLIWFFFNLHHLSRWIAPAIRCLNKRIFFGLQAVAIYNNFFRSVWYATLLSPPNLTCMITTSACTMICAFNALSVTIAFRTRDISGHTWRPVSTPIGGENETSCGSCTHATIVISKRVHTEASEVTCCPLTTNRLLSGGFTKNSAHRLLLLLCLGKKFLSIWRV